MAFLRVERRNRSGAAGKIVESSLTHPEVKVDPIAEKRGIRRLSRIRALPLYVAG